jgi:hypothetical protein
MYRRPKFLEILLEIRQEMAREADYDVDLFTEIARSGKRPAKDPDDEVEARERTPDPELAVK